MHSENEERFITYSFGSLSNFSHGTDSLARLAEVPEIVAFAESPVDGSVATFGKRPEDGWVETFTERGWDATFSRPETFKTRPEVGWVERFNERLEGGWVETFAEGPEDGGTAVAIFAEGQEDGGTAVAIFAEVLQNDEPGDGGDGGDEIVARFSRSCNRAPRSSSGSSEKYKLMLK